MTRHISEFAHKPGDFGPNPKHIDIAMANVRRLDRMYEARPIVGEIELRSPAHDCPMPCTRCWMVCAIIPARLAWWEGEVRRLGGMPKSALRKDGVE